VTNGAALDLMNGLLWHSFLIAAPVLMAALITGLLISVLQVATQIQEATLSYVPKLIISGGALVVLGPWMLRSLTEYARGLILMIPSLG
jgi:flagellar biosynthesis protein FliQ